MSSFSFNDNFTSFMPTTSLIHNKYTQKEFLQIFQDIFYNFCAKKVKN